MNMEYLPAPSMPDWINDQLKMDKRYMLDIEGWKMHVMESGNGFPVLMVHGNPTWGFLYRKIVDLLPKDTFRCIMPDLIGLGFSDKPRNGSLHQLENHGRWMDLLIRKLGLTELILVVQDWGGPIGMLGVAEQLPVLKGLVVLNTTLRPPKPGFKPTWFHRLSQMPVISDLLFRGLCFPQRLLSIAQGDPNSISGIIAKAYIYPLKGWRNNVAPLALARMVPDSQVHPSVEQLKKVEIAVRSFDGPSAIVWGKRDPVLGRVLNSIKAILPQSSVELTGAGHFIQEEEPEKIAAAIQKVFKQLSDS